MKNNNKIFLIIIILIIFIVCMGILYISKPKEIKLKMNKEAVDVKIEEPLKTYLEAIYLYSNSELEEAKEKFTEIINYEQSSNYIEKINQLEKLDILGLWYNWFDSDTGLYIDITPNYCYMYVVRNKENTSSIKELHIDEENFRCGEFEFTQTTQKYVSSSEIINDKVVVEFEERIEYIVHDTNVTNRKAIFDNRQFGKSKQRLSYEPEINMTRDKVLNSTWGKPNKINEGTTSLYTYETWYYKNNKNIYFKNGIVTQISD